MRVYIIGNDGIILCREPPAAVNEGEIVVASNEELRAAQLNSKPSEVFKTPLMPAKLSSASHNVRPKLKLGQ